MMRSFAVRVAAVMTALVVISSTGLFQADHCKNLSAEEKNDEADLNNVRALGVELQKEIEQKRKHLDGLEEFVGKSGRAKKPAASVSETPPTPPQLPPSNGTQAAPVSAVRWTEEQQERAQDEIRKARSSLEYAERSLARLNASNDASVAAVEFRDAIDKLKQTTEFTNRARSVVDPPPVQVRSVAPERIPESNVIVPPRPRLTFGGMLVLGEVERISQIRGDDVRTVPFDNQRWLQPAEPIHFDPEKGPLTVNGGATVDVRPVVSAVNSLPGREAGAPVFAPTPVKLDQGVVPPPKAVEPGSVPPPQRPPRLDEIFVPVPEAVQALNDPKNQAELDRVGGVSLQVTLDLLSYYGVPGFRRRGPVKVVERPVLLSLRTLVERARPFSQSPEKWDGLPEELRFPGSMDRIHGFVLDDPHEDVVLVGSAAREGRDRIDINCLIVGLQTTWRDNRVPAVSLDPLPGRPAGPQYSRVEGAPFDSLFARIMLDADYAMKRITSGDMKMGIEGFHELQLEGAKLAKPTLSRFWLTPVPLGLGELHVSPTSRTLLFESGVRCLTEEQAANAQWSGRADPIDEKIARLFSEKYEEIEESGRVEPPGIFRRMHALVDIATVGKILRDMRISYATLRDLAGMPVQALRGPDATPRSYAGLDIAVTKSWHIMGGADVDSRLGRRSLDMYQDVTTMTLEQAVDELEMGSELTRRLDFEFALPKASNLSQTRVDLLMMKGRAAAAGLDLDAARDCYREATAEDPFYADAWTQLANTCSLLGRNEEAKSAIREAVRLEPDDVSLIFHEVAILTLANDEAADIVGQQIEEDRREAVMRYLSMRMANAARASLDRGIAPEKVRAQVDDALSFWPENSAAWYVKSLTWPDQSGLDAVAERGLALEYELKKVPLHQENGPFLSLLLWCDVAMKLEFYDRLVAENFASWKQDRDELKDAIEFLEELAVDAEAAEQFDPHSGLAVGLLAQIYAVRCNLQQKLGVGADLVSAMSAADDAVTRFPEVPDAHYARAMVLAALGRAEASQPAPDRERLSKLHHQLQSELDQALKLDPSYGPAYLLRAALHAAFGGGEKALADLESAKRWIPKLDPRLEESIRAMVGSQRQPALPAKPTTDGPKARTTIALLDILKKGLRDYRNERGSYPDSGIANLARELGPQGSGSVELTAGQTDKEGRIIDGWGHPLTYLRTDEGFRLYSTGPDGHDDGGSGDDVELPDK